MMIIKNPNIDFYEEITAAVQENGGYCPCKVEKTPETKCICEEFKQQDLGKCHCGRFIKIKDNHEVNLTVSYSFLKRMMSRLESVGSDEISFEYLIGSCFPNVYQNIMETISDSYVKGFMDGYNEKLNGC